MADEVERRLAAWAAAGHLTREQVAAILEHERAGRPRRRLTPLLTEILGYVGGVLVTAAVLVPLTDAWETLSTGTRLTLLGTTAISVVVTGGFFGRGAPPLRRLRSFLFLLAPLLVALGVGELADRATDWEDPSVATAAFGTALGVSLPLWWFSRGSLQHLAVFVSLVGAVTAAVSHADGAELPTGLSLIGIGAVWTLASRLLQLPPPRAGRVLGAVTVLVGAQVTVTSQAGDDLVVVGVVAAAALLAVAVPTDDAILLAAGVAGLLIFVPQAVVHWFPDVLGTSLALLACGLVLLGAAVLVFRTRR